MDGINNINNYTNNTINTYKIPPVKKIATNFGETPSKQKENKNPEKNLKK